MPANTKGAQKWSDEASGARPLLASRVGLRDQLEKLDPQVFTEPFRRAWLMYLEGTVEVFRDSLDLAYHPHQWLRRRLLSAPARRASHRGGADRR